MIKKVRAAFMFLSVSLFLAHTFVPHHHFSDPGGKVVYHSCVEIRSYSLVDLIASFFEQDLGSDHLSQFIPKKLQASQLHYVLPQMGVCLVHLVSRAEQKVYPPICLAGSQDLVADCSFKRGPPLA